MAYNLNYLSGTSLSVPDNGVASVGGITLPGKNYLGYGSIVDQDLLYIVENFATSPATGPSLPIAGQVWYDYRNTTLKFNTSTNVNSPNWVSLATSGGNATVDVLTANTINTGNVVATNGNIANLVAATGNIGNLVAANANIGNLVAANGNIANLVAANGNIANLVAANGNIANLVAANGNIANLVAANANIGNLVAANGNIGNLTSANINGGTIKGNILGNLNYTVTFNDLGLAVGGGNTSPTEYNAGSSKIISWNTIGAAKGDGSGAATAIAIAAITDVSIPGGTSGQVLSATGVGGAVQWTSPGTFAGGITTNSITTGAPTTPGTITGAWTLTAGSKLEATYADLAERHHSDAEYPVGTVMTVGGANEITACPVSVIPLGVISDQYAYLMNAEAGPDETHPAVGYLGRVPVRVIGPIDKHQRIAPAGDGLATAADKNSFGWALETNNEVGEKLVLCLIK